MGEEGSMLLPAFFLPIFGFGFVMYFLPSYCDCEE